MLYYRHTEDRTPKMTTPVAELVLVPFPLTGHLVSMVELARILAESNHRLSITVLLINIQIDSNASALIRSLATSTAGDNNIRFTTLVEEGNNVQETAGPNPTTSIPASFAALIEHQKPRVRDIVAKLTARSPDSVRLVLDTFCMPLIDVGNEFGLPWYVYLTSGASVLSFALHLQALHDESNQLELTQFMDSDSELDIPGFANPVPAKVFPASMLNEAGAASFLQLGRRFRQAKGILVNTYWELESRALSKFGDAIGPIPPVYPVGPILNLRGGGDDDVVSGGDRTAEIFRWLDGQPKASVVFLCFGSKGCFPAEQVKEIARGLENRGQRFLWSLRQPRDQDDDKFQLPGEYEDPGEVLPEGFLKRTAEKGKVIGWAPQVAVLSHGAVGGFVSHCGWNSVLESVWFGVPIATWPMYAEQQVNAFVLTRELGLAAEITVDYRNDGDGIIVSGDDVERGIRALMEGRDGDDSAAVRLREKAETARQESRRAVIEGGSSYTWIQRFADNVTSAVI